MSAKGRGEKLDATGQDFYPTPDQTVRQFARVYTPRPGILFEPCCGDGAIIKAWPGFEWWGTDIRPEAVESVKHLCSFVWAGDCRTIPAIPQNVSLIVSNPPYNIADSIIRWALDKRGPTTDVAMLMRLPWLCAKAGREWIRRQVPDSYVVTDRPKFKKNKSDMADYAWMVWPAGAPRTEGRIFYCDDAERAA